MPINLIRSSPQNKEGGHACRKITSTSVRNPRGENGTRLGVSARKFEMKIPDLFQFV